MQVLLSCACDQIGYCIILVVDQAFGCCEDTGYQGVPGIGRVTFHITNHLGPMGSGDFVG